MKNRTEPWLKKVGAKIRVVSGAPLVQLPEEMVEILKKLDRVENT